MTWKRMAVIGIPAMALVLGASGAAQAGNLVVNGGFEDTANVTPPNYPDNSPGLPGSGGLGLLGYNTLATPWTSPDTDYTNQTGYNFIMSLPTAISPGVVGYNGGVGLIGPPTSNNGLMASPVGGNFLAADADTQFNGAVQQTISGLTIGATYQVGFYWALAQEAGAGGMPTAQWQVSLGSETQATSMVTLPSTGGFVPWMYQTINYTATGTSEVLSFLATENGPLGGPPFLLLDGVTMQSVPEPSSILLLGVGLLGAYAVRRLRRRTSSDAV